MGCGLGWAQATSQTEMDVMKVPLAAQPSANFNADRATDAYMSMIPPSSKARSDAYFEGGYWLILWDFLFTCAVSLIILELGWSARMRSFAEQLTRFRWLQTFLYWMEYFLLITAIGFPLGYYEDYVREHKYGLATQNFRSWLGDELTGDAVGLLLMGVAVVVLFAIVRRLRRSWWIWGTLATIVLVIVQIAIAPVFIQPLFNKITPLHDPHITEPILSMARANGIPATDVYQIDASRQSTRISANVSGFGSTTRISLNDNLLRRGSPEEIQAVMGHEMGHYVMRHIPMQIVQFSILIVLAFTFLSWVLGWAIRYWGVRWGIRDVSDPAVVPLAVLLISVLTFVSTPLVNTIVRTQEKEADIFGLNAARQPDGFAQAALQLSEYRKMRPGPVEEFLFFDHPSGYYRIHSAMVWKGENLKLFIR